MEEKKALLVVSFGTSHHDTREKTIDRIEAHLAHAFPDRRVPGLDQRNDHPEAPAGGAGD